MSLRTGQTLAHYEILDTLGAGAMGEVYRAKDSRLGREVAIKVLPEHFASDAERLLRFEREAKTLAALNHPNVAQIFGVDQVGDTCFLVLELVPGESLEERLKRGPLPIVEAVDVCRQIAAGLEAAHEAGVIHRDLKPANVRLTPDGKVKVLDFGLAKPARDARGSGSSTDSVLSTEAGRLLGTPTYMAPEQARGKPIDRRVDVWAFGCVLHECLTGQRAFAGESLTDVLAAVIEREPDFSKLPAATPARLRELLADCLAKDPHARARDIGEVRRQLERSLADPASPPGKKKASVGASVAITLVAAIASSIAGAFATRAFQSKARRTATAPPTRFVVSLPDAARQERNQILGLALSPDGRTLAVSARSARNGIYLRELGQLEPEFLPGTEGAGNLCFSPDGRRLAYFDGDHAQLRRVTLDGGKPQTISPQTDSSGIAWGPDGTLAMAPRWGEGLFAVRVDDGVVTPLTKIEAETSDRSHLSPSFPLGAKLLLFQVWTGGEWEQALIKCLDLETRAQSVVLRGGLSPNYLPFSDREGAVLYARGDALWARRFDPSARACRGDEVMMIEGIQVGPNSGQATIALSASGTFAYQPKIEGYGQSQMWWVDRDGNESLATPEKVDHETPSLSADGARLVYARGGGMFSLYSVDLGPPLEQRSARRLTFDFDACNCVVSPEGASVVYSSNRTGAYKTYVQDLAGDPKPRMILEEATFPCAWSPDRRWIAFLKSLNGSGEIWIVAADGSEPSRLFVHGKGNAWDPRFSPDGGWLSYVSDDDGRSEISVVSFPAGDRRVQVTNGGGSAPRWSRDGTELFYRRENEYFATQVAPGPNPTFGAPKLLFKGEYDGDWSSVGFQQGPDGRFLMNKPIVPADRSLRVVVIENFVEEVKVKLAAVSPH